MKKALIYPLLFLLVGSFVCEAAELHRYEDKSLGIAFYYPQALTIDKNASREAPLSVVFNHGQIPFVASILFKEIAGTGDLEEFIKMERQRQEQGGYKNEVQENRYLINQKMSAIEFVRESEIGTIYYFVFPSVKTGKLMAFWHTTSDIADPDRETVKAYQVMRKNLEISQ